MGAGAATGSAGGGNNGAVANLTATFTEAQTLVIDDEEYFITGVEKVGTIVAGVHWSDGDYWTRDELQLHKLIANEPLKN